MSERYDDEALKFIETRKRIAQMRRAEAIKKRNMTVAVAVALVVVVIIIAIAAVSCSGGGSTPETTTAETTTVKETTTAAETTTASATTTAPETTTNAEDAEYGPGKSMYVIEDNARLRAEANENSEVIDLLDIDSQVSIIAKEGDWVKISCDKGEGYVHKDMISGSKGSQSNSDEDLEGEE